MKKCVIDYDLPRRVTTIPYYCNPHKPYKITKRPEYILNT